MSRVTRALAIVIGTLLAWETACFAIASALNPAADEQRAYPEEGPATQARRIAADAEGIPIHPGVRGMALSDSTLERGSWARGIPDALAAAEGSALRGVAGGLYADLYDWRTRVSSYHSAYSDTTQPRPPTLQFLRWARDHRANLFITVNTRGLVRYDPVNKGKVRYYTSDTLTLARLASDWVRYTNHIVPTYRQGDRVANARDDAILKSLVWSSKYPGDSFDTLLARGETPVAPVNYWEIGNEPTVSVAGGIGVSNGYRLSVAEYAARYKAIAAAMKAEDPSIKVGPCVVNGTGKNAAYLTALAEDPSVPIDFVSYHPYQKLGQRDGATTVTKYLGAIYRNQEKRWKDVRAALAAGGRDPDAVEMVASEINVSDWRYNETPKEGQMAHAIGSVETVFSFARLGLTASHYWIWPANPDDGTRYPVYMAYEKLRDYLGDRLLDVYSPDNRARVYTTRDTKTGRVAVWALNFQNATRETVELSITGIPHNFAMRRLTLRNVNGPTTLTSGNYSGPPPAGPRREVDWVETPMRGVDPANLTFVLEPATISIILAEP